MKKGEGVTKGRGKRRNITATVKDMTGDKNSKVEKKGQGKRYRELVKLQEIMTTKRWLFFPLSSGRKDCRSFDNMILWGRHIFVNLINIWI